jgi:hypothetical protein
MQKPFGYTLNITLSRSRTWFTLGPGWAALAGLLSTIRLSVAELNFTALLQLVALWLLVDPLLGTLWELAVRQGLWRRIGQAQLPPPTPRGFWLPYVRPGSPGGRLVLAVRRYRLWWRQEYWPQWGDRLVTFVVGTALVLLIGLALDPTIFWLTLLAVVLVLLAGVTAPELDSAQGGRLQSVVQLILPWGMGAVLYADLTLLSLALAVCYWVVYWGGLRMLGQHRRADLLFFGGQGTALLALLALRLLPGAAIVGVCLAAQLLIRQHFSPAPALLHRAQPYLVVSVLAAGLSLGILAG